MFFDWDTVVERLRICLAREYGAPTTIVPCIEGASEFQAAFESQGDYDKPAIFVVPVENDFEANTRFGGSTTGRQCRGTQVSDRASIITVTQCPDDNKLLSASASASRMIRREYFCCLEQWTDLSNDFSLAPVNGLFIRSKQHQEYWWSDTWQVNYKLENCNGA